MSPLAEHLEGYLAIRRGLGFQLGTAARIADDPPSRTGASIVCSGRSVYLQPCRS
jgi:hypothetical protein